MEEEHKYPESRVEAKNLYYADLLLQDYAGNVSENTAIHLYVYQNLIQKEENKAFKRALHEIAITEMHHLHLLGETILLLGKDPKYEVSSSITGTSIPWTSTYVNYEKDMQRQLELDIKSEIIAIENYKMHRNIIDDKYIKELLTIIIDDEKRHIQIFENFLNKIKSPNV